MTNALFDDLKVQIEKETGFHCFENSTNNQLVFYGTSDKESEFKALVENKVTTGTIMVLIDTGESAMYSAFKNAWY